jgi:hypothetical protein
MLHTRNCKTLHEYLYYNKFDMDLLSSMLNDHFGELVSETETHLEEYFGRDITNVRQYWALVDAKVAEMYHLEHPDIRKLQRQECFILANNFIGEDETHANMFVSRFLMPMINLFDNVIENEANKWEVQLKYIIINFHDTNLSNLLRFIEYFSTYGYHKYVKYSSSVRFEFLKEVNLNSEVTELVETFRIRVVFDGEEIKLPYCEDIYCKYEEFRKHFTDNLNFDLK